MHFAYRPLLVAAAAFVMASAAFSQPDPAKSLDCEHRRDRDGQARHCEMRDFRPPVSAKFDIDAGDNGGVTVKGWNRSEVLVRARVEAWSRTESSAKQIAAAIRVATEGGNISSSGPRQGGKEGWAVSYEVFVPTRTGIKARTLNGGITLQDIRGEVDFAAVNGGVSLRSLGGNVRGHTVNGGLNVVLTGTQWDGDSLDVKTTNGGVDLQVPAAYNARLEARTVNGGVQVDFPVTVSGELKNSVNATLGKGGPLVRATTTNGGVQVRKKA